MSIKLFFNEENKELFWKYWNELSKNAGYRYFPNNIKIYNLALKSIVSDKSFVYLVNGKPEAMALLPIEKIGNKFQISFNDSYVPAPLYNKLIENKIFSLIDDIAKENQVAKIKFEIDPLGESAYNYLQKYGYRDATILNYVIDLTFDDLLGSCRKGHRNEIKRLMNDKDFTIFYIEKNNADYDIFSDYIKLHHKCAGRVTRPKETFDLQYDTLKNGKGVLFGLKYKEINIAFVYFEFNKEKGVYYSCADDPDYDRLPLYHVLIYKTMEYLKKNGVKYIDTGQPSCPSPQTDYEPDQKQLNIAFFKRGFGGDYRSQFRGIKYY